jgi:hypothetical protein
MKTRAMLSHLSSMMPPAMILARPGKIFNAPIALGSGQAINARTIKIVPKPLSAPRDAIHLRRAA